MDLSGILGVVGGVGDSDMRCGHASGLVVIVNVLLFLVDVTVTATFQVGGISISVHLLTTSRLSL